MLNSVFYHAILLLYANFQFQIFLTIWYAVILTSGAFFEFEPILCAFFALPCFNSLMGKPVREDENCNNLNFLALILIFL